MRSGKRHPKRCAFFHATPKFSSVRSAPFGSLIKPHRRIALTVSVGDKLPEAKFKEKTSDGMEEVSTADVFAGKKVVLFAVPGAFTPTCDMNHLPGYIEHRDTILGKGVDDIAVVAVNDAFVMSAWSKSSGGEGKIRFLSDWDASFTKAIGMETDLSAGTLGVRSKRYSMVVEDGVVKALNVEDAPGQATKSGAAAILEQL
jgi:glutaredoxin/glutathione-dependent peroxiredoxin